ncbi:TIGR02611 family protein [Verrucosispora sp. WMMA2121]|uniref:TIGR02611 family protein n=1 Tax=Verrucosispora sp. WMMA2121 TaxID=3015164 RepID=UPI0022B67EBB|nr:TIGR02611 family protein [Verrucosispora sp. WMMA2121]MCZ7420059.1 TIGR02611 family protein [Verrucosispora sp. WMMA2121]
MDAAPGRDPSNVAVRTAEQRGYGVPKKRRSRHGRSVIDHGRSGGRGAAAVRVRNGRGYPGGSRDRSTGKGHRGEMTGGVQRERGGVAVSERRDPPPWRQRISTTLALIRANPTGRIALKIIFGVLGALVVTLGIALIPLPGPGWLLVIAGLGIWAVEFHWAKRLLAFTRRHVHGWTAWVKKQSLPVRLVIGSIGLVFVGAVALLSIKYSLGIDVIAQVLHYLATH